MDLEATVYERFKSFGTETMGTLGSFMVGANTELLNAENGEAVAVGDIITTDDTSSVTISGDFSFVSARGWMTTACVTISLTDLAWCRRKTKR